MSETQETGAVAIDQLPMSEFIKEREKPSSVVAEKQAETISATETEKPSATVDKTAKSAAESETAKPESEEEKPQGNGGFQRRIKSLTKELGERDRRFDQLMTAHEKLMSSLAGKPAAAAEVKGADEDPEPKEDDFTDFKDFTKALGKWSARQEHKNLSAKEKESQTKAEEEAEQQAANDDLKAKFDAHGKRVEAAREKYEDWDEVAESLKEEEALPEAAGLAIMEMNNGEEILYHLAKNPDVRAKLKEMSPFMAIQEIGRISDRLTAEVKPSTEAEKEKPSPKPKPVTAAPAPIKPVGGASAQAAADPDKMSMPEFTKWRDSQRSR